MVWKIAANLLALIKNILASAKNGAHIKNMSDQKQFDGAWLQEWMARRRLTPAHLAQALQISVPTVYLWQRSIEPLPVRTLRALRDLDSEQVRALMTDSVEIGEALELARA